MTDTMTESDELRIQLPSDDEDLTEDQIQDLLHQAKVRLSQRIEPIASPGSKAAKGQPGSSLPRLSPNDIPQSYVSLDRGIARLDSSRLVSPEMRGLSGSIRKVVDPVLVRQSIKQEKEATAGSDWFNLPRTNLTPELKRDLQLLKMRSVLDPKRHYKKESGKLEIPPYSQVGTIIEGPTEFYSSRIAKKERKRTLVEDVLAINSTTSRFDDKYKEIQAAKTSGKKAHYAKLKAQRKKR